MTNTTLKVCELIASGLTPSKALSEVYKIRKVYIPFNDDDLYIFVRELGMSMRTTNALLRNKMVTLCDLITYGSQHKFKDLSGLGKASMIEVLDKIIDVAWEYMSTEERAEFLITADQLSLKKE